MNGRKSQAGLSLLELIALVAVMLVIAGFLLPQIARPNKTSAKRIRCVNNLKNVGLAFRIFATDNNDKFPPNVLATNDAELISLDALTVFRSLSNELSIPKILQCPEDKERVKDTPTRFDQIKAKHISYFASLSADETFPASFLAGDRNILTDGKPIHGVFALTTNHAKSFSWSKAMHIDQGNITMGDGSVQQMSSSRLRQSVPDQELATNYLAFP